MKRFVLVALAAVTVGCNDSTPPEPTLAYGFLVLNAMDDDAGYRTRPTAIFYRTGGLLIPTSHIDRDSCVVQTLQTGGGPGSVTPLDAGTALALELGDASYSLEKFLEDGLLYYADPDGAVPYTPGDSLVLTIPGATPGYPAATIRAMTAESFTIAPVGVPAAGAPIELSWTPAIRAGSKMTISLRYATPGSGTLNQQIVCHLIDDGAHAVPAELASGWRNAQGGNRETVATRLRTSEMEPPGAALQVASSFTVPTPLVP